MKIWCDIVKRKGHPNTLLIFDCYYFSQDSRKVIYESGVHAIASVMKQRFVSLVSHFSPNMCEVYSAGDASAEFKIQNCSFVIITLILQ